MNIVFIEDHKGFWEASVLIRCQKTKGKHPGDNWDVIESALKQAGYEVTGLKFSTPDFMSPIEKQ